MMQFKQTNPTALVTGATGAIGGAIVQGLLTRGYAVTIVARDASKGERTAAAIAQNAPSKPGVEICDLSARDEIFALSQRWRGPLHVLVNNAAECPRRRQETREGIERQLATNVLGYFRMVEAFVPILTASAPARVVNVASYWAGGLNLDDLEFRRRRYDNDDAYRQSKQADRMLTAAFAERLREQGIAVNACHPGDVPSKLASDLGFGGHETPEEGARTPIWLATSDEVEGRTGRYFAHCREERCPFAADHEAVTRLFEICAGYR